MRPFFQRLVALLQGLFALGCLVIVYKLVSAGAKSPLAWGLASAFVALAVLGFWAMLGMWRELPSGAVLTLVLQLVHLLYFETASLTYAVSLPASVVVGLDSSLGLHHWLAWKPAIEITVDSLDQTPWVGVNLLALLSAAVSLAQLRRALARAGVRLLGTA